MEGYGGYYFYGGSVFFIKLGAGEDFADNLYKTAVRVMMSEGTDIAYLERLPIWKFMRLVEEIIEVQREREERRKQGE